MFFSAVITVIAGYLFGSINFAVIFSSVFMKRDIRKMGSGNAGATNVMRNAGFLPGLLTFICDALKGFAACMIGKLIFQYIYNLTGDVWTLPIYGAYICGVACMAGHIFPIFFQFKGGKGVATAVGIFSVCCPLAIVVGLAVFAIVLFISKIVSLSSLIATVTVVSLSIVFYNQSGAIWPQALFSIVMGVMIFVKHRENIKRLISGEEAKLSVGRKG